MRIHRIRCQAARSEGPGPCGYSVPMPSATPPGSASALGPTERQILEAAGEIIATEDFDALSMRRVAAKANVSLSTVVRHFGTKDALVAALVAHGDHDEER